MKQCCLFAKGCPLCWIFDVHLLGVIKFSVRKICFKFQFYVWINVKTEIIILKACMCTDIYKKADLCV